MLFKRIHFNYLVSYPIIELITKPDKLSEPFQMFSDIDKYSKWYSDKFLILWKWNAKDKRKAPINLPYVKNLGMFMPESGYNIRNLPLLKPYESGISLSERNPWMQTLRLFPNWKTSIELNDIINNDLKIIFNPLIVLYPFGIISYNGRFSIVSKNGINLNELVTVLKNIEKEKVIITSNGKFDISGIIERFHKIIVNQLIKNTSNQVGYRKSNPHKIITVNAMEGKLDPEKTKKEIFALDQLETNTDQFRPETIENYFKHYIKGMYADQFFIFNSRMTVIFPSDNAQKSYRNSDLRRRVRRHYSSMVEFSMGQEQFTRIIYDELKTLDEQSSRSAQKKEELEFLIKQITNIGWIKSENFWDLVGRQKRFYSYMEKKLGLEKNLAKNRQKIKEIVERLNPKAWTVQIMGDKVEGDKILGDKVEGDKITVKNSHGNVIKSTNVMMNQQFNGTGKEDVGEHIAQLRAEIESLKLPSDTTNKIVRETENLEEEVLKEKPDEESIVDSIIRIKKELEKSGQKFDTNSGWGGTLKKIWEGVKPYAPAVASTILGLLSKVG